MSKFKVMVEGRNCLLKNGKKITKLGFFTTRLVESCNRKDSENKALLLISEELRDIILNDVSQPPVLRVVEVYEIQASEQFQRRFAGFTWYPED